MLGTQSAIILILKEPPEEGNIDSIAKGWLVLVNTLLLGPILYGDLRFIERVICIRDFGNVRGTAY